MVKCEYGVRSWYQDTGSALHTRHNVGDPVTPSASGDPMENLHNQESAQQRCFPQFGPCLIRESVAQIYRGGSTSGTQARWREERMRPRCWPKRLSSLFRHCRFCMRYPVAKKADGGVECARDLPSYWISHLSGSQLSIELMTNHSASTATTPTALHFTGCQHIHTHLAVSVPTQRSFAHSGYLPWSLRSSTKAVRQNFARTRRQAL